MASYLMQSKTWQTRDKRQVPLADLELSHMRNIVAMLERQAAGIEFRFSVYELQWLGKFPMGEQAELAIEENMDWRAANPVEWLHTLPLVKELDRLIAEKEKAA